MLGTLDPDVVHWFLAPNVGSAPVPGAEHLARYWRRVAGLIEARRVVDHALMGESGVHPAVAVAERCARWTGECRPRSPGWPEEHRR